LECGGSTPLFMRAIQSAVKPAHSKICRPSLRSGRWGVFQGSSLTLGQMADACVYVGEGADVDLKTKRLDSLPQGQD